LQLFLFNAMIIGLVWGWSVGKPLAGIIFQANFCSIHVQCGAWDNAKKSIETNPETLAANTGGDPSATRQASLAIPLEILATSLVLH
jgi:Na+/H+-translocating membrane pyrophosphatase